MKKNSWAHVGEFIAYDALRNPSKQSFKIASIEISTSSNVVVPLLKVNSNGATKSNSLQCHLGIEWFAVIFAMVRL